MEKILVLSRTGSVGKSFIAKHLLSPRVGDLVAIENLNHTEEAQEKHRASDFSQIFASLITKDKVVVDLGASEYVTFFDQIQDFGGFDLFSKVIVPTNSSQKEKADCVACIDDLLQQGVDAKRIFIIFSRVPAKTEIKTAFADLIAVLKAKKVNYSEKWTIYHHDFLKRVSENKISLSETVSKEDKVKNKINELMGKLKNSDEPAAQKGINGQLQEYGLMFADITQAKTFKTRFDEIYTELNNG